MKIYHRQLLAPSVSACTSEWISTNLTHQHKNYRYIAQR